MYYLIPLPIIFIAAIVRAVSLRYKLTIFSKIATLVLVLSSIWFIYEYCKYSGFDIIQYVLQFFKI